MIWSYPERAISHADGVLRAPSLRLSGAAGQQGPSGATLFCRNGYSTAALELRLWPKAEHRSGGPRRSSGGDLGSPVVLVEKLDGHEDTPIDSWHPKWLEGRIRQLDEAKEIIKRAEAEWDSAEVPKKGKSGRKARAQKPEIVTASGHR
jgi:hypothetical protein